MRGIVAPFAVSLVALGVAVPALAQSRSPRPAVAPVTGSDVSMRQLLRDGFQIRSENVIAEDISRRIGDQNWTDGLLVTLQKGTAIAFCHYTLKSTLNATELIDHLACNLSR